MSVTRLLLFDNDVLFRETLGRLLESEPDLAVSAQCGAEADALDVLTRFPVEMVFLELEPTEEFGFEFIAACRGAGYEGKILVITRGLTASSSLRALQLGASGIFLKVRGLEGLLTAIRRVASGQAWLEPDVIRLLASGEGHFLTDREQRVLRGVLDGLTNRRIAERMGLPETTVKAAVRKVFQKAG